MSEIDRYLNEVCWAMGGSLAEQQAARDELRNHIREAARELELEGVAAVDALRRALLDLGDAETVGRAMRSSRGTAALRRPLAQPIGALMLEPRRGHRVPMRILFALFAWSALSAVAMIAYLWPG